jgi:UDP-galactopyranose mutase
MHDFLIIGAGFSGAVCAQQLAEAGKKVLVLDKRNHIGGNAYDEIDSNGFLIHPYGPHIFHTNSDKVFEYLSRFTKWHAYEHRVLAKIGDEHYPIPINRKTINKVFGLNLQPEEVQDFLDSKRIPKDSVRTSEDVVLNSVGHELCELFFRGYTRKQWDMDLSELSAGVAARIPTRTNDDDRYFSDKYQVMPLEGYTKMFEKMLSSPLIETQLCTDFFENRNTYMAKKIIYTGPIDAYYKYCYGPLPYRSLSFAHEFYEGIDQFQPVGTVNYPKDELFTRITEFKHLTGDGKKGTSIVREYSQATGDPYYPVPNPKNDELYKKYQAKADLDANVYFVGRLAQYRYYNMDQAVAAALKISEEILTI